MGTNWERGGEIRVELILCFTFFLYFSHKLANAEHILSMKMVSMLLFRLLDETLTIRTIKSICNVISALIGIMPRSSDIQK